MLRYLGGMRAALPHLPLLTILALGLPIAIATAAVRPSNAAASSPEEAAVSRAWDRALRRGARDAGRMPLRVDHSTWEDPWVCRGENYVVRTTRGRGYGLRMARSLDGMLQSFQSVLDTEYVPADPFLVLVHPSADAYNQYGDDHSDTRSSILGGFYDDRNPGRAIATYDYPTSDALVGMWLTHAATQQYLARAFPGTTHNVALSQGLGAYFQTFWNYDYWVGRFEALRDADRLIPLAEVLTTPLDGYTDRPDDRMTELAMLFTYLRRVREDTRSTFDASGVLTEAGPFDDYLRKAARGEDVDRHPVGRLMAGELDEIQQELVEFRGWR